MSRYTIPYVPTQTLSLSSEFTNVLTFLSSLFKGVLQSRRTTDATATAARLLPAANICSAATSREKRWMLLWLLWMLRSFVCMLCCRRVLKLLLWCRRTSSWAWRSRFLRARDTDQRQFQQASVNFSRKVNFCGACREKLAGGVFQMLNVAAIDFNISVIDISLIISVLVGASGMQSVWETCVEVPISVRMCKPWEFWWCQHR